MKKQLSIDISLSRSESDGEVKFTLTAGRASLRDLCLGLVLIKEKLVDSVVFTDLNSITTCEVTESAKSTQRRLQASIADKSVCLQLASNQIEVLLVFLLKYYRDGVAEVDHLDLEGVLQDHKSCGFMFTIKVPDSTPPVSRIEAIRILKDR